MPWTEHDYPNAMKNLEPRIRTKAIDIANALLDEGYAEGGAIAIGIAQAKRWAAGGYHESVDRDYHVVPHPQGWAVRREGASRASTVFATKEEAQNQAIDYARNDGVNVILHDDNGRITSYAVLLDETETKAYQRPGSEFEGEHAR